MVLDTSAILAILLLEDGWAELEHRIVPPLLVSTVTVLEASLVMGGRYKLDGIRMLGDFLSAKNCIQVPFEGPHREAAVDAFLRYGKGNHPARLNFGDCISYGLAKAIGQPLLWVGSDFDQTDILRA